MENQNESCGKQNESCGKFLHPKRKLWKVESCGKSLKILKIAKNESCGKALKGGVTLCYLYGTYFYIYPDA